MGAITLQKSIIEGGIFASLLANVQCDTGDEIDTIGFTANYINFHMNFYGCLDSDHAVVVEGFGREISGDWQQMAPTEKQLWEMQQMIYARAKAIEEVQRQQRHARFPVIGTDGGK